MSRVRRCDDEDGLEERTGTDNDKDGSSRRGSILRPFGRERGGGRGSSRVAGAKAIDGWSDAVTVIRITLMMVWVLMFSPCVVCYGGSGGREGHRMS